MPLRVYSTLTRTKEEFRTHVPGKVSMYLCGPTVYKPSHVGHMVGPIIFDTVKRYLAYLGYEVTFVVNITDVDDKLIKQAALENTTMTELAERVTADYLSNLERLGVTSIDFLPRATHHIVQMIDFIQGLIEKGFAYPSEGDVYFDVTKDADYGKLCNRDPEQLEAGARIPKSATRNAVPATSPCGRTPSRASRNGRVPGATGRPGWHIECSAMSRELLGDTLDIHGGGLDLTFPHHENELAQSESFTGKPFARYWMHNGLMRIRSQAGKIKDAVGAWRTAARPVPCRKCRRVSAMKSSCAMYSPVMSRRRCASCCSARITAVRSSTARTVSRRCAAVSMVSIASSNASKE